MVPLPPKLVFHSHLEYGGMSSDIAEGDEIVLADSSVVEKRTDP